MKKARLKSKRLRPKKLTAKEFAALLSRVTEMPANPFHPFVWIIGKPDFGKDVQIGGFSEVNAKGARVQIGDRCDIASFVAINCADSHKRSVGMSDKIERRDITIEHDVFIGSHAFIKGGAHVGHHCVIAAGTVVEPKKIPPYSLVVGNPMQVKPGYYRDKTKKAGRS